MHQDFSVSHRADLVALGQGIGKRLFLSGDDSKTVLINGAGNSGKSLIALAIDSVFRPHLYQDGIAEDISANERLDYCRYRNLPVIFNNFYHIEYPPDDFDWTLHHYASTHAYAKVVIGSNFLLLGDTFKNCASGLPSRHLDMHINVPVSEEKLDRKIGITVRDGYLLPIIQ